MSNSSFIRVAFFDLGDTLIGDQRDWLPGAQATLAKLCEKKIRLGLISNTANLSREEILEFLPEDFDLDLFEKQLVIFSSEVKLEKPNPEIFQLAIKRAKVKPKQCLFCTEEPSHILIAKKEKMQTAAVKKPPHSDIGNLVEKLINRGLLPV